MYPASFLSTNEYREEESTNYHKGTQIYLLSQRGTKNENENEDCHTDGKLKLLPMLMPKRPSLSLSFSFNNI